MLLAQNQDPPTLPGQTGTVEPSGAAGNGGTGAPAGSAPSPFGGNFFLLMILLLGAMILFSIMGQRRERKKREAMLSAVRKHDRVQTIGGVIGSVVEVKPDYVVLKVDEASNTRLTFARSAVQQVLKSSNDKKTETDDEK